MNKVILKNSLSYITSKIKSFLSSERATAFLVMAVCCTGYALAAGEGGAGAFDEASRQIGLYFDPVKKIVYAIACILCIVGAFNVYFKMQNGDQDVKKTIMLTLGGCIALVALVEALPTFFK